MSEPNWPHPVDALKKQTGRENEPDNVVERQLREYCDGKIEQWTREQIQGTGEGVPAGFLPSQPLKKGEIVIVNGRRAVVDGTYELQQAKLVEVSKLRR